ncbi:MULTISPECIES: hypothetical protein [Arthrobacter]|uniref:DUF3592 domain-containing protein n=2 Tax=Arthrobacter TaxID=1663 RepID=A0ABU9KL04_9MICC|nr:hypothetical protein [Arthrobacter sp. YJM1]MDP5227097.1 hypothetical protein [Arthrobacter sp. YJM1]
MNETTVLGPGLEVRASKPFGDTPAREVDGLMAQRIRSARMRTVFVSLVFIVVAFGLWHEGKPIWGFWPEANAVVISQTESEGRYGKACDLGLKYSVYGQQVRSHSAVPMPCESAPRPGASVTVRHDQFDYQWGEIRDYPRPAGIWVMGLSVIMFVPLALLALYFGVALRRVIAVRRLREAPWFEITATVKASTLTAQSLLRLTLQLTGPDQPEVELLFGIRPISFFPIPTTGSPFSARVAGTGDGKVLVALPGHTGVAFGSVAAMKP